MLIYFQARKDLRDSFGVNLNSILISIGLAIAHGILEGVQLTYEARACKTSFINYCAACFNGRFGWVPFVDNLSAIDEDDCDHNLVMDFDNIHYSDRFVKSIVPFKFSDASISTLCLRVNDLPDLSVKLTIKVGTSIDNLPIEELHKIIMICGPKSLLKITLSES